jgi:hypothetical protein
LTAYERLQVQRFNAAVLANLLYPGVVNAPFQPNYVDQRLTVPKLWRDVYHHDAKGNVIGWTRFDAAGRTEFTADGGIVIEKDDLGRCRKARTVRYSLDLKAQAGYNQRPLRFDAGEEIVTYEYASDDDRRGRVKGRERASP